MHWARYCVLHPPPLNKQDLSKIFQSIQREHKFVIQKNIFITLRIKFQKWYQESPGEREKNSRSTFPPSPMVLGSRPKGGN